MELSKQYDNEKKEETIEGDPFKTLFVGRLNFKTDEEELKREFGIYGPIKSVKLIRDRKTDKSKGYAFVEYESIEDFKRAYKKSNGKRIDGKKVLVDAERGHTVKGWLPMRLGGGKGTLRGEEKPHGISERRKRGSKSRDHKDPVKEKEKLREDYDRFEKGRHRDSERDRSRREKDRDRDRERHGSKKDRHYSEERRERKEKKHKREKERDLSEKEEKKHNGDDHDDVEAGQVIEDGEKVDDSSKKKKKKKDLAPNLLDDLENVDDNGLP
mmetsp:Transcript_22556/g.19539  ORF Transcript_22556/g.19539 Transcript_22556/m.19539 type:complete len:270 (-) Transcript_22556:70-879(-)